MTKLATTLLKGFEILEAFPIDQPKLKLHEVAQRTGLPSATVYRLLRTLISLNHIQYDQRTGEYYLGQKLMSLGLRALANTRLRESAYSHLEELSRTTDQNVNMGILDGAHILYVERIIKRRILHLNIFASSRLNTFLTSCGRAILAYVEEEHLRRVISELMTIPEARRRIGPGGKKLIEWLNEVRRKGYALSNEELARGMRTAGAPIFDSQGKVEAAINIATLSDMCSLNEFLKNFVPPLLEAARNISWERGYEGTFIWNHQR